MKLMFIGAAHEVTGSCHYLNACGKHILVDCGMEQGVNVFENAPLPVEAPLIDYVLLTHAHVDHSGMLPLLYSKGFRGQILMTEASADLCSIMLRDCAHIQLQLISLEQARVLEEFFLHRVTTGRLQRVADTVTTEISLSLPHLFRSSMSSLLRHSTLPISTE